MMLEETTITRAIIQEYTDELLDYLETDVAIVGAGPSGLAASYYLSKAGIKTVIFERKLSVGGGMWGGGMMFNKIVVQDEGKAILDEMGIRTKESEKGYHVADSVEAVAKFISKTVSAGTKIFNLITVEDVMIKNEGVGGLVLNWTAVEMSGLHIDPLTVKTKKVIDATGHDCEVVKVLTRKAGCNLDTKTGKVMGERPMWAEKGESSILDNTKEVYPNLYVSGMAANAVFGSPRMGPIFGGMFLSGKKAADLIKKVIR
ncbi:MAG: sulfide-dependent adenosine diphosphate thiazole synthase [Euryarchaeota archaeon]|nr:sulfide-dependent adenosine diphosphate thiazole synthase [Euryarchaeota archaeon]